VVNLRYSQLSHNVNTKSIWVGIMESFSAGFGAVYGPLTLYIVSASVLVMGL
jgi:hypothetical protein